MKTALFVPFRLGSATSEQLSKPWMDLYLSVSRSVVGEECSLALPMQQHTIPLENSTIADQPAIIYVLFQQRLSGLLTDIDVVVVDLANPAGGVRRGALMFHIARAASGVFDPNNPEVANAGRPKLAILVPTLPSEHDDFLIMLRPHIDRGDIVLIADDGTSTRMPGIAEAAFSEQHRLKVVEARHDPAELLSRKLIRRLGHFKRTPAGSEKQCTRYFYEGSLCQEEIATLLAEHIDHVYPEDAPQILYYCPLSPWLETTIIAVATDLGLRYADARKWEAGEQLPATNSSLAVWPLIIFDMVDTGETAAKTVRSLRARGLNTPLRMLSILTTKSDNPEGSTRTLTIVGEQCELYYLLEVEQRRFRADDCPMCALGISHSSETWTGETLMLATYDMWEMALDAGIGPEQNAPSYRESMDTVPSYPVMIEKHGAWLASKIRRRLELRGEGLQPDVVLVCPDNRGPVIYSDYLRFILGFDVIRIPHDCFEMTGDGSVEKVLERVRLERPTWYTSLLSITTAEIIVVDDFNRSGRTFRDVRSLLEAVGKRPACYFPLVDMNPAWSRTCGTPAYSLYEWQSQV